MGLRDKLKRLERNAQGGRWELRCPACGWEITCQGDVPLNLILLDWEQSQPEPNLTGYHPDLLRLASHEHDPEDFIDKRSGLPLAEASGLALGGGGNSY
jgi:hypothetical protein